MYFKTDNFVPFNSLVLHLKTRGLSPVQTNATFLADNVGSCGVLLHVANSLTGFRQTLGNKCQSHATTCNRVCKQTQHVTSKQCSELLANNVTSVCTGLYVKPVAVSYFQIQNGVYCKFTIS